MMFPKIIAIGIASVFTTAATAQLLPFSLPLKLDEVPPECYYDPAHRAYVYRGINCFTGLPIDSSNEEDVQIEAPEPQQRERERRSRDISEDSPTQQE